MSSIRVDLRTYILLTKQFTRELNELRMSEDIQDNIMFQDIITKNEIATGNSIKLIEMSLTEIGVEASTQTGGVSLRELEGLDKELRMISSSLRSAIAKAMAKQVDIDKENRKLEEMANDETYSDEQREKKCKLDYKDSKMNKKL